MSVTFCLCLAAVLAINEDNDHYFKYDASLMTERELVRYVDGIVGGGAVTDFFMCPCGQRTSYASTVWEPIWKGLGEPDRAGGTSNVWCANAKLLHDRGIDPYAVWISRCRAAKVRPWISMRMNDVHGADIPNYFRNTTFWRTRRDLWRCPKADPTDPNCDWEDCAFDYAHKEVRDYHFALFRELVDRYDADGCELDWMRFRHHLTPGKEPSLAPVLTDFVRRCRAYADEVGVRRGKRLLLSVRVPTKLSVARERGLDPVAWAKERLVDWIVATNFYDENDFAIDLAGWRAAVGAANPDVLVLPGASDNLRRDGTELVTMKLADFRRWAVAMRARGAQGLYLFNVPYLPENVTRPIYAGALWE